MLACITVVVKGRRMPLSDFFRWMFQLPSDADSRGADTSSWETLTPTQIESELTAIEQLLAIDAPVPDEAYRFLGWAMHRAHREACRTDRPVAVRHQLLLIEAFESLLHHRSTTLTQRLQNDRHYLANLARIGIPAGDPDEIIYSLQQALDRIQEMFMNQGGEATTPNDGIAQSLSDCLNMNRENWRTPLHKYLQRYALDLVDVARSSG
jgi:hypothetical protein